MTILPLKDDLLRRNPKGLLPYLYLSCLPSHGFHLSFLEKTKHFPHPPLSLPLYTFPSTSLLPNNSSTFQPSQFHITVQQPSSLMAAKTHNQLDQLAQFEDFLPTMAEKLGGDALMGELCNGFNLLMDGDKKVITFESLKRNTGLLGLQDLSDEDLRCMLIEGDFDGDGALNQMEFCVLMFRLSPDLMQESHLWLEDVLQHQEF